MGMEISSNLEKYQCQHAFAKIRILRFYDTLSKLISSIKPRKIISLGCGEGFDIRNICSRKGVEIEYYCGLDINMSSLEIGRKELNSPGFDAIMGDLYNLPCRLSKFDLILCLEVLEHLLFPEKALREIAQNANAYCVFSVPNEPLYRLARMLVFKKNIRQFGNHPEHMNHWSAIGFKRLLGRYFRVEKVETPFPWTIVLCSSR